MIENLNVTLEVEKNAQDELEVNGLTRRALINNSQLGLSFYDLVCRPRQIEDIGKLDIDYKKIDRVIKEILRCNICLQIFNEPVNIRNCLHKFCKKCIEDYNRRIKKECALCRHPIETRRLMREDYKMREIIRCLIPNLEKFNEVEDKILTNFLPDFCFKDSAHKIQQQEKQDRIDKESYSSVSQVSSSNQHQNNASINYASSNNLQSPSNNNELLQRKKSRSGNGSSNRNRSDRNNRNKGSTNSRSKISQEETNAATPANEPRVNDTVGVKLICDTPNEQLQKYFSKTDKIPIEKTYNLRQLKEDYNIKEGESIRLFFTYDF